MPRRVGRTGPSDRVSSSPVTEIAESAASGHVADAYAEVRRVLGSTFVPTLYRVLAPYPLALERAVAQLESVVALAEATGFSEAACADALRSATGSASSPGTGATLDITSAGRAVLDRYRAANPLNLLLCLRLLGTSTPGWPAVMEPPLPAPGDGPRPLLADVRECHGGVVTPGLWRELADLPDDASRLWRWVRERACIDALHASATRVRLIASRTLEQAGYGAPDTDVTQLLPPEASTLLAWFPTGISTMIVEAEWMFAATNTHEETP